MFDTFTNSLPTNLKSHSDFTLPDSSYFIEREREGSSEMKSKALLPLLLPLLIAMATVSTLTSSALAFSLAGTERANLSSFGAESNGAGASAGGISSNGRYAVFSDSASNLVRGDTNGEYDVPHLL